jgi:hypothetical protein
MRSISSLRDTDYYAVSPTIVEYKDNFYLFFKYSKELPCYFMVTRSKIKDGKLIFFLSATSSSGSCCGNEQFEEIKDVAKLVLIKKREVYWLNTDESTVPLTVGRLEDQIDSKYIIPHVH